MSRQWRPGAEIAAFALAYFALCRIGLAFVEAPQVYAAVWPASGLAVGALVVARPEQRWRLLVAVALGNLAAQLWGRGLDPITPGIAVINVLESAGAAWIMRWLLRGERVAYGSRRTIWALAVSATVAPAVAGLLAAGLATAAQGTAEIEWAAWALADGIGILTVAPLLWAVRTDTAGYRWARGFELLAFWLGIGLILLLVFLRSPDGEPGLLEGPFLLFPILLWAALRLSPRAMALALALIATTTTLGFADGRGPFVAAGPDSIDDTLMLQAFLAVVTLTTLIAAAQTRQQITLIGRLARQRDRLHLTVAQQQAAEAALAESERRYRLLLANLPDAMVALYDHDLIGIMAEGQLVEANRGSNELFVGRHIADTVAPDQLAFVEPLMRAALKGKPGRTEYVGVTGVVYDVEILPYRDESSTIVGVYTLVRSIADRRRAEQLAERAQAGFQAIFDEAPIGVAVLDAGGRVTQANPAISTITGHPIDEIEGSAFIRYFEADDARDLTRALERLAPAHHHGELELRCRHADGHLIVVDAHLTLLAGDAVHAPRTLVQVLDVTDHAHYKAQLRHLAEHDPLTQLANRRRFEVDLDRHLDQVARYGADGAVIVLDIDDFKQVNDTLGHHAGDELIVTVARVLHDRLRGSDVLARLGGDEFAILLPRCDRAQAEVVAAGLVDAVREQATFSPSPGRRRAVTISLGVALLGDRPGRTGESLIADADLAMYDAKEDGRDTYAFFSSGDRVEPKIKARMAWIDRIDDALVNDGFTLLAQPILDLRSGVVTQYELLLRMRAADGSLISPAEFLPIAERYDLITRIDAWVVEAAVGLLELHAAAGDAIRLEVNLSGRTIGDAAAVSTIETIIAQADIDPRNLVFEVTETAAVADIAHARAFAERMRALGCRFALDDFGAGFGSFYYLKHLPFDYVKIDGEFVAKCLTDETDQLVIRSIVQIATGLQTQTIAEFVPDEPTRAMLESMGVDYAQGYHVGRPAPLPAPGTDGTPVLPLAL